MHNDKEKFLDDILSNMNDDDVNKLIDIINSGDSYEDKLSKLSNEEWDMDFKNNNEE